MKTTLEIDPALYAEVKVLAARRNVRVKDLVDRGLRRVIEEEGGSETRERALGMLARLRASPLQTREKVDAAIAAAARERREGWLSVAEEEGS